MFKKGGAKMPYEYKKLRGRIVEKYGSIRNFSKDLNISEVSLSKKMNCKTGISQKEMDEWAAKLDIPLSEYGEYFFV